MRLSPDAIGIIVTMAVGFVVHVFYFGRMLGKFESDLRGLAQDFKSFREAHYIPREEYEARHKDIMELLKVKRAES
jgi:hypothetical protein